MTSNLSERDKKIIYISFLKKQSKKKGGIGIFSFVVLATF